MIRTAKSKDLVSKFLPTNYLMQPYLNTENWNVLKDEYWENIPKPANWMEKLKAFQDKQKIPFHNITLLKCAVTHHGVLTCLDASLPIQRISNRSLEFLGDSILGMNVSSFLFQSYPYHQEGQLTQLRSQIVNNTMLSTICVELLKLDQILLISQDIQNLSKNGQMKGLHTVQAGAVEALIAAIYLDQGLTAANQFVNEKIIPFAVKNAEKVGCDDPISTLQMKTQEIGWGLPIYKKLGLHKRGHRVALYISSKCILTAIGSSYKNARISAAKKGLIWIEKQK